MDELKHFFHEVISQPGSVFNPESLIRYGGITLLCLIIFMEIGLFFCFWFPGDSLVFTAGVLCATGALPYNLTTVLISMSLSGVAGNMLAYWFGKRTGANIMKREDSWYFRKQYVHMAHEYYKKNEATTLIIGNFIPIIRTFAPMVAGIIKLSFSRFILFSTIGILLWIIPLVTVGYFLGNVPFVKEHLGYIILGMVIAITTPVAIRVIKESRKDKAKHTEEKQEN